jgi:hypothetical protein
LSTVAIGGAIGALALYLMQANKNQPQKHRVEKVKYIPHLETEGVAGRHISTATATDESGSPTAEIPISNNLSRAARGNS